AESWLSSAPRFAPTTCMIPWASRAAAIATSARITAQKWRLSSWLIGMQSAGERTAPRTGSARPMPRRKRRKLQVFFRAHPRPDSPGWRPRAGGAGRQRQSVNAGAGPRGRGLFGDAVELAVDGAGRDPEELRR